MLGPVMLGRMRLARCGESEQSRPHVTAGNRPKPRRLPVHKPVPRYIAGFLVLAGACSLDLVPHPALEPIAFVANVLTVVSMAASGLGTRYSDVCPGPASVAATVALSLLILAASSFGLIRLLHIA